MEAGTGFCFLSRFPPHGVLLSRFFSLHAEWLPSASLEDRWAEGDGRSGCRGREVREVTALAFTEGETDRLCFYPGCTPPAYVLSCLRPLVSLFYRFLSLCLPADFGRNSVCVTRCVVWCLTFPSMLFMYLSVSDAQCLDLVDAAASPHPGFWSSGKCSFDRIVSYRVLLFRCRSVLR